ncbi:MAG: ketopantoate reductase family protein [Betaproteobacteria bacterium]|nr:MAG: ketopantoate reductase family protein [Betaproteobacteria bacterium]
MRILILGAGATGGYFGARLMEAGTDVSFLVRPSRAAQLRTQGLVVESPCGGFRRPVPALLESEIDGPYDLVVLSCKAYDLESAADAVVPGIGPNTLLLPLLNGLAHYDLLDTRFGRARVAGGCCHLAAMLDPVGAVRHLNAIHRITFGIRDANAGHARSVLDSLANLFARTRVECLHTENVMQELWEKYIFLCTLASMTCLMRAAVGDVVAAEGGRALMLEALEVCAQTAARSGFPPRSAAREDAIRILTEPGSAFTASMLRDLEAGHRLESNHLIGDMLRRAEAVGVAPGLLRVAYVHLLAREARRVREAGA